MLTLVVELSWRSLVRLKERAGNLPVQEREKVEKHYHGNDVEVELSDQLPLFGAVDDYSATFFGIGGVDFGVHVCDLFVVVFGRHGFVSGKR